MNHRPHRTRTLLGGLAVVALTATACGGDDGGTSGGSEAGGTGGETAELTTVRIGTLPIANAAAMYLGMEQGFFEEEGLTLEPTVQAGGSQIITGLVADEFDFGFVGWISAGVPIARGLPVCVVTANDATGTTPEDDWQLILTGANSPMDGPEDLAGKRIGVNALGGVAELQTRVVAEKAGIDPASLQMVEMPFPDMPAAIASGTIDAAYASEPFVTTILDQGGKIVVAPGAYIAPEYPLGNYMTSQQTFEGEPELVEAFTTAMNRSTDYARDNPDAVREIIPTYTQIPAELAQRIRLPIFTSEIDEDAVDEQMGFLEQYGVVDAAPSADDLLCG
ncbi:ABC transporter substrate-binding protein [Geodermatophilus sp. CPCC 206100]|uniref:ABC transporter substrate-binding protein n=1 Tax=Geodermatophilus sp. CPCC 206100 TaxID=3020054 RepID=UPI003B00A6AD